MKPNHYMLIAAVLGALALQIRGLHDWHAALDPQFVAGVIGVLALHIGAIYTDPPQKSDDNSVKVPR